MKSMSTLENGSLNTNCSNTIYKLSLTPSKKTFFSQRLISVKTGTNYINRKVQINTRFHQYEQLQPHWF